MKYLNQHLCSFKRLRDKNIAPCNRKGTKHPDSRPDLRQIYFLVRHKPSAILDKGFLQETPQKQVNSKENKALIFISNQRETYSRLKSRVLRGEQLFSFTSKNLLVTLCPSTTKGKALHVILLQGSLWSTARQKTWRGAGGCRVEHAALSQASLFKTNIRLQFSNPLLTASSPDTLLITERRKSILQLGTTSNLHTEEGNFCKTNTYELQCCTEKLTWTYSL